MKLDVRNLHCPTKEFCLMNNNVIPRPRLYPPLLAMLSNPCYKPPPATWLVRMRRLHHPHCPPQVSHHIFWLEQHSRDSNQSQPSLAKDTPSRPLASGFRWIQHCTSFRGISAPAAALRMTRSHQAPPKQQPCHCRHPPHGLRLGLTAARVGRPPTEPPPPNPASAAVPPPPPK